MSVLAMLPVFRLRILSSLAAVCLLALIYGSTQQPSSAQEEVAVIVSQLPVAAIPLRNNLGIEPEISALSAYVTDENSGAVLYSKNATLQYAPASVTKLMTVLVAREQYAPKTVLTIPTIPALNDTRRIFAPGDQLLVEDLIAASLIQSSNDAAFVLAESLPGGSDEFVRLMNAKAKQLHLNATVYTNSIGFDHPEQKTTARDTTLLAREVLRNPINSQLVATQTLQLYDVSAFKTYQISNTNQLLFADQRISGVKTGTTTEAGQVLISRADVHGNPVLITVLGSQDRYADTMLLLDWLELGYSWQE